jgi:hypothetical protein
MTEDKACFKEWSISQRQQEGCGYEKGKDAMSGAGGIGYAFLYIIFRSFDWMVRRDGCGSGGQFQRCGAAEG